MANKTFSAGVKAWATQTKAQLDEILQDSVMDILDLAQTSQPGVKSTGGTFEIGKIPVDIVSKTGGGLIKSLVSELNGAANGEGETSYIAVAQSMKSGDYATFSWTMPYARAIEYGWTTSTGKEVGGRQFVGHNAAKWPEIVAENTKRIMSI